MGTREAKHWLEQRSEDEQEEEVDTNKDAKSFAKGMKVGKDSNK